MNNDIQRFIFFLVSFTFSPIYSTNIALTKEEFISAVTSNGYPAPESEVYQYFVEYAIGFSREEIAMFVAQLIHESGGFQYTEQLACLEGDCCEGMYADGVGLRNKTYHGRGYIQLTWGANYKVASEGLGMEDRLLREPELVAADKKIAMMVSVWYWNARVKPLMRAGENMFGLTTKGINPDECAKVNKLARRRYQIYLKVANVLKLVSKAKEDGCYRYSS